MRIVYVEDNIANVHLVKRVARMGKHEIINYIDGMDALNNFETDKPDLVLMDIQLAGELTGIEVVKKLRSEGYDTPIIAVTAYAMVGDRERCIEAGCTGYMSKPLPVTELVKLFQEYDKLKKETAQPAPTNDVTKPTTSENTAAKVSEKNVDVPEAKDSTPQAATIASTESQSDVTEAETTSSEESERIAEAPATEDITETQEATVTPVNAPDDQQADEVITQTVNKTTADTKTEADDKQVEKDRPAQVASTDTKSSVTTD